MFAAVARANAELGSFDVVLNDAGIVQVEHRTTKDPGKRSGLDGDRAARPQLSVLERRPDANPTATRITRP